MPTCTSYFDIIFAMNKQLHPGEKRLLQAVGTCEVVPDEMQITIHQLIKSAGEMREETIKLLDNLVDNLDRCM